MHGSEKGSLNCGLSSHLNHDKHLPWREMYRLKDDHAVLLNEQLPAIYSVIFRIIFNTYLTFSIFKYNYYINSTEK
jgi:hypothetical protein